MDMAIDQTGHQRQAIEVVDGFGRPRPGKPRPDLRHLAVDNDDVHAIDQLTLFEIQEVRIPQNEYRHENFRPKHLIR